MIFTITGGFKPYKYQTREIDRLWGEAIQVTGNTQTITLISDNSLEIKFSDSTGKTKSFTVSPEGATN